jgi:hypothetical protein
MSTPSELLAAKITDRLVKEGLITAEAAKRFQPKLAGGTLRSEDWLPVELADKQETK